MIVEIKFDNPWLAILKPFSSSNGAPAKYLSAENHKKVMFKVEKMFENIFSDHKSVVNNFGLK